MNNRMQGKKIYVAGHRGLAGSALLRRVEDYGHHDVITRTHAELDLTDRSAVREFFAEAKPELVIVAAAKVGGIIANRDYPADFVRENLAIAFNVIDEAYRSGAERLVFLGSSCVYPRDCPQPIKESYLLSGPLEMTNRPYALAKIAAIEMCWAYNRQYGTKFVAAMPTNLYGPNDNYDLKTSHVLPALIRKIWEAKQAQSPQVVIWGTGQVRREFLHSDDMADGILHLLAISDEELRNLTSSSENPPLVNIGTGEDVTIRELAQLVAGVVEYKGEFVFDANYPDGTPRKLLDVSRAHSLGWRAKIALPEGVRRTVAEYAAELKTD
jgi:GDP-L-fucose synthase